WPIAVHLVVRRRRVIRRVRPCEAELQEKRLVRIPPVQPVDSLLRGPPGRMQMLRQVAWPRHPGLPADPVILIPVRAIAMLLEPGSVVALESRFGSAGFI